MFENTNAGKDQAPVVKGGAMNASWTYSYIGRSPFYAMINARYQNFMSRFVRNWLWWADGWVPYFHNAETGIPSTRLAQALINKTSRKIVGGRLMYKNAGKDSTSENVNPSVEYIAEWAKKTNFEEVVKKAVTYATAAGTALLKLNCDADGELWAEAQRFDTFLPEVNSSGEIVSVECFIECVTNLGVRREEIKEGGSLTAYYLVEKRYYSDFRRIDGTIEKGAPTVCYVIKQAKGSVVNGDFKSDTKAGEVNFHELPKDVKQDLGGKYRGIEFGKPIRMPFRDLGCELVKFTEGINGLPELPFGESLLAPILTHLEQWDYYNACAMTDMYLGRGRVLVPKAIQGANSGAYSGMDETLYTKMEAQGEEQKPLPIQFELRAGEWESIRTRIIQDISITTGLNISTIASFVSDNTAARTAREISTEENETAAFINDKRALMEKPINRLLKTVLLHGGCTDEVVLRWSGAGLTNRYALAEIIQMGLSAGFLSKYQAVQMFNFDDDTQQVQEEFERIKNESDFALPEGLEMNDELGSVD